MATKLEYQKQDNGQSVARLSFAIADVVIIVTGDIISKFVSTYGFQNIYSTDGFRHFSLFLPHKTCQIKLGNCSGRNKSKKCIGDIEAANAVNGKLPFTMAIFPL